MQVPSSDDPPEFGGGLLLVISGVGCVASGAADPDAGGTPVCGVSTGPAGPGLSADGLAVDVGVAPASGCRPPERPEPVQE
ncbi:hypothetical protein F4558_005683 [Micromonospora profundi]|nr:hypothetical protein [Micromonospora profundi]